MGGVAKKESTKVASKKVPAKAKATVLGNHTNIAAAGHDTIEPDSNILQDAGVMYGSSMVKNGYYNNLIHNIAGKMQAFSSLLQGGRGQQPELSVFDKMEMINQGISKQEFEYLKQKCGLDYDQLSEVLSVARATLINKKGTEKFNYSLSEKIVSLADIYAYGYEVFEDEARFNQWVFRPNRALGGKAPYYFLNNQYGREEVKNLIGRIDYGVYA